MIKKQTAQLAVLLSAAALLGSIVLEQTAMGATSTITVTATPFLSFTNIPDPFQISSMTVPIVDTVLTSDANGALPASRFLNIRDTRNCGGLNLQLQASAFSPVASLNSGFRTVTYANDAIDGIVVNGVKYLSGFTGDTNATAPLNAGGSTFGDPALFTSAPFDTGSNILNTPVDIIQGALTAPTGRNGTMHVGMSFYLEVPKFLAPGDHFTTLTFTLADDTAGTC